MEALKKTVAKEGVHMQLRDVLSDLYLPVFLFPSPRDQATVTVLRKTLSLYPAVFAVHTPPLFHLTSEVHRVSSGLPGEFLADALNRYALQHEGMLLCLYPCNQDAVRFLGAYGAVLEQRYLISFTPPTPGILPVPDYLAKENLLS